MCISTRAAIAAAGLVLAASGVQADTRSAPMIVRVNVVRACSIDTSAAGTPDGAVNVTCGRGNATGITTSTPGSPARVVPVPPRQTTTILPARVAVLAGTAQAPRNSLAARRVVTLNF